MDSKERVRAAINREPVDEVPLGFYVVDYDTIERVIGRKTLVRNKIETQIAVWEGRRDELVESYKKDTVEFYKKLDCVDLICFKECPIVPSKDYEPLRPRRIDEVTWEDKDGNVYQVSELSNMIARVDGPARESVEYTVEMFEEPVEDVAPDPSIFEAVDYLVEQLGGDRYIMGKSGGVTGMMKLGGMAQGCLEYALHPEVVKAATRRNVQTQNLNDKYYIRPGQDGVLFEHDTGSSKGPLISPKMFREFCYPAVAERTARVKEHGMQIALHNCGNNRAIIDQFVDAGIQCYQSLQTQADMEVGSLKAEFGDRMAFWGGVALDYLVAGTPDDVRANVRSAMERAAPGGGFILGPSHSIAMGTKYENFMAMLDEYDKLKSRYC